MQGSPSMMPSRRWQAFAADRRAPWIVIAIICVVGLLQNVYLSGFTGQPGPLREVWIYETSSGAVLLALVGLVAWASRRFPLRDRSLKVGAAHVAVSIAFSVLHVSAMVAIRKGVFILLGHRYNFGPPVRGFAYEYGKDFFTYAVMVGIFTVSQWARESIVRHVQSEQFRAQAGFTVKTTRGNVFVPFSAIVQVESSGNYVTLVTASAQFLHRATMKEIEELLPSEDFARTHRSHLVRLSAICSLRSRPDGEKVVELQNGRRVPLSRTYAAGRDWTLTLPESGSATRAS